MATTKQWMRFFLDAGIPPDSAAHYAVTFEQNRMGLDMVGDLDKEYLRDLKITALGDIISILRAAKKHQDRTEREAAVAKREKVVISLMLMLCYSPLDFHSPSPPLSISCLHYSI